MVEGDERAIEEIVRSYEERGATPNKVINQLLEKERTYLETLRRVGNYPLRLSADGVEVEDLKIAYEAFLDIHRELHILLGKMAFDIIFLERRKDTTIEDVFGRAE